MLRYSRYSGRYGIQLLLLSLCGIIDIINGDLFNILARSYFDGRSNGSFRAFVFRSRPRGYLYRKKIKTIKSASGRKIHVSWQWLDRSVNSVNYWSRPCFSPSPSRIELYKYMFFVLTITYAIQLLVYTSRGPFPPAAASHSPPPGVPPLPFIDSLVFRLLKESLYEKPGEKKKHGRVSKVFRKLPQSTLYYTDVRMTVNKDK